MDYEQSLLPSLVRRASEKNRRLAKTGSEALSVFMRRRFIFFGDFFFSHSRDRLSWERGTARRLLLDGMLQWRFKVLGHFT